MEAGAGPRTTQRGCSGERCTRCCFPRRAGPEQHMLSSCCQQPKPLEAQCAGQQAPDCWRQRCSGAARPARLWDPRDEHRGWRWLHLESRTQAAGQLCSTLPAAGMSHLVGSHLQSVLLKQFHSLGGWKTGHQLQGSEERALSPQTSPEQGGAGLAGGGRRGAKSLRPRGRSSPVLQAQPGGPRQPLCTLALGLLGQSRGWGCPLTSMAA